MTSTELGYLSGVTSNIQDQLNGKALSSHSHDAIDSFVVIKGDNENTNWASAAGTDGWVEQISNGSASFQWRRLTNSSGNYFNVVTDGWFYQNEGKYYCIDSSGGRIIAQESRDSGALRIDSCQADGRNIVLTNTTNAEASIRFCKTHDNLSLGFVIGYKAGGSSGIGVWSDVLGSDGGGNIIQFLDTGILLNPKITYGSSFPGSPVSGQLYFLRA